MDQNIKKRKNCRLLISICMMLILVLISAGWIAHRTNERKATREKVKAVFWQEDGQSKTEESAAAVIEAVENEIASHVYSHRGSEGPEEHSFKVYDAAIEAGSRYIEQDVVISSDGILYVSHDLNAVTMTGYNGMYEYMSSDTIDGLTTKAGNKVLHLSEVFDRYGKDINYVIELKPRSDECIDAFAEIVDKYGLADVITVQSMYPDVLEKLEDKFPDMPKLFVAFSQSDYEYIIDKPYVDIVSVKMAAGLMTEDNCSRAHEAGKQFSVWTLNTEREIKNAIDIGADTYFTNDTPLALSIERIYGLKKRGHIGRS